jgi:hypothetical protein
MRRTKPIPTQLRLHPARVFVPNAPECSSDSQESLRLRQVLWGFSWCRHNAPFIFRDNPCSRA